MLRISYVLAALIAAYGAAAAAQSPPPAEAAPALPAKSLVYACKNPAALHEYVEDPAAIRRMVDAVVLGVTQEHDLGKAWRTLVSPTDRVGIKVSTEGGRYFSSHRGVVEAILQGLEAAGIPRSKVVLWDRLGSNLHAAGFTNRTTGCIVRSIDPPDGFDLNAKVTAPVFGKLIWGDPLFQRKQKQLGAATHMEDQLSADSHFATILTHEVTKIINVPVYSDGSNFGVAGALYNMTMPNIDNNRRFAMVGGPSSLVDLYGNAAIGPKVVINILDGLIAQYAGGPGFNPNYSYAHQTIYASKDPVALDATVFRQLEVWRQEAKLPPIGEHGDWLQEAEVMSLGRYAPESIEIRPVTP